MRRSFASLLSLLALGVVALTGCGYAPYGYGGRTDRAPDHRYPGDRYGVRHVAYLPGGGEVVRDGDRLVVVDRNGRRYDYGRGRAEVCHNGRTKRVSDRAVQAHLRHGDRFGPCRGYGSHGGYGYGGYDDDYYDDDDRYYGGAYGRRPQDRTRGYEGPVQGNAPRGATSGTGTVSPSSNAGKNGTARGAGERGRRTEADRSGDTGRSEASRGEGRRGRSDATRSEEARTEERREGSNGRNASGGRGSTRRGNDD